MVKHLFVGLFGAVRVTGAKVFNLDSVKLKNAFIHSGFEFFNRRKVRGNGIRGPNVRCGNPVKGQPTGMNHIKHFQAVFAIGNPGGEQFARSLTMGVISGVERQLLLSDGYEYNLLQTDAAINPGNSGGPLVDCHGCVIGINSVKIVDADFEGMGFAIPINTVRQVLEEDDPDLFSQAAFAKEK